VISLISTEVDQGHLVGEAKTTGITTAAMIIFRQEMMFPTRRATNRPAVMIARRRLLPL
jgi:hypothetical protein